MTVDSPKESPEANILHYSIISSDEDERPLTVRLKVSKSNPAPQVVLERLGRQGASPTGTPRKRKLSPGEDGNLENLCSYVTDKMKLTSPVKRILNKTDSPRKKLQETPRRRLVDENAVSHSGKRRSFAPVRFADEFAILKSQHNTENIRRHSKRYTLRTTKKYTLDSEEDEAIQVAEALKKSETETSSRVLRSRSNSRVLVSDHDSDSKTKSSTRGRRFKYASNSEEDEALKKSEIKASLRVLRSRSNSRVLVSDHDSDSKTKSSTRDRQYKYTLNPEEDEAFKKSEIEGSSRVLQSRSKSRVLVSDHDSASKAKSFTRGRRFKYASNSEEDEALKKSEIKASSRVLRSRSNSRVLVSDHDSDSKAKSSNRREEAPPKTPKNRNLTPKITPKNRLKMIRDGTITPSMHLRKSIIQGDSTPLMKARTQLHVSYVPLSLPCREKEYLDVENFIRGKLEDGCGGCIYISGVPGTGKTATVTSVIDNLAKDRKVAEFSYVNVNGMRLTEPRQAYVEIWKQLTGKTVPWEQAQNLLEERFTKKKKLGPVVMLIDELDILCTKRQDVVYNLLDWPTKCKGQLIVITIANTMDLPERLLMSRVTSRLGLTRLTFQAYTHKQLMEIVTKRLMGSESFNSDAIQLVSRKVASVSGDARRALDICRRAAEIAEQEGKGQTVNIMHINEALTAMITQPQVMAIRRCSRLQKLLLQAVVAEVERTGVEETTFFDVFKMLVSCCALDGFKMVSSTYAQRALCQLSACKLVLTDQKCSDIYQRIILNVSVHDVYFALKKE